MDTDTAKTQVKDAVSTARDTASEQAGQAMEKSRGLVRTQVDARSLQAGEQAQSLADTLHQTAGQLRESGDQQKARYARIADQGAERLERAGGYLRESDADEILAKAEDFARKQPLLIAGAGLLLGIAAARLLKASSSERYERTQALARPLPPPPVWELASELDETARPLANSGAPTV